MRPDLPLPTGLKPTLRQLMIVMAWCSVLLSFLRLGLRWGRFTGSSEMVLLNLVILLAAWPFPLLAGLLWILDRRGPARGWYLSSSLAAGGVLACVLFLLWEPACLLLMGRPSVVFPVFPICGVAMVVGTTL